LNELALFAGAGGGLLASRLLGWRTICAVEIEPYCRQQLLARQRDGLLDRFPIWDDVRTFDGHPWRGKIDVISGGFPCQDISVARNNSPDSPEIKGLAGKRSGLWSEFRRIIEEVQPAQVFIENSPNLRTNGLVTVLQDLNALGFDADWGVLSAGDLEAPHGRKRMWVMATDPDKTHSKGRRLPVRGQKEHTVAKLPAWWEAEPKIRRVDDGMAHWVDRVRSLGNGQVPIVGKVMGELLSDMSKLEGHN
jgi:DNA (cytosine-5)-methyltransferase 1